MDPFRGGTFRIRFLSAQRRPETFIRLYNQGPSLIIATFVRYLDIDPLTHTWDSLLIGRSLSFGFWILSNSLFKRHIRFDNDKELANITSLKCVKRF